MGLFSNLGQEDAPRLGSLADREKSMIEQELGKKIQIIPIKGVGSHVEIVYVCHLIEALQKAREELKAKRVKIAKWSDESFVKWEGVEKVLGK